MPSLKSGRLSSGKTRDTMEPVVITAALTGAQQGKEANQNLPEQPDEIISQAVECVEAGASIVHIHARDREGQPTADPDVFAEIVEGIRNRSDAVINLTTGGAVAGLPLADRVEVISRLKPEIGSFSLGSGALLGRWSDEAEAFVPDKLVPLFSSYEEMQEVAKTFREAKTKPELEIYHSGMIGNLRALHDRGSFTEPLWVNFVTGIGGEITDASVEALLPLKSALPKGTQWLVSGIGARNHFRMAAASCLLGGHMRVGLEDSVYLEPGVKARSNADLVERAVRLARDLGRSPTNPGETRRMLDLTTPQTGTV